MGRAVGSADGTFEGATVGAGEGASVGEVGASVGTAVGVYVGVAVGALVGTAPTAEIDTSSIASLSEDANNGASVPLKIALCMVVKVLVENPLRVSEADTV